MSTRIAPVHPNEIERMRSLSRLEILDSEPERAYDDIVELASAICETPIAAMTLIADGRQWFKAKVGLPFDETPRQESFCAHAILQNEMLVVSDASVDDRFSDMLVVQYPPALRFYAGSPIQSPDGQNLGTLCVLDVESRELTKAQHSALEALRRLIEQQLELRRANLALVRLERQKRELTELVVHDLKNPIASILPNARWLARSKNIGDKERSAADDISSSTQAMLRLVMNLLDISRAEDESSSGSGIVPKREDVDVAALIEEIRATLAPRAVDQAATLTIDVASDVGSVSIDRDLVRRVLENLGDNAMKYAPGGNVSLGARLLEEEENKNKKDLLLTISDDGPGVPPEHRERIFEKYARIDGSPHAERSRGLGLTFCRLAAEAHGGRIYVEEAKPHGSVFCVRLPTSA